MPLFCASVLGFTRNFETCSAVSFEWVNPARHPYLHHSPRGSRNTYKLGTAFFLRQLAHFASRRRHRF